MYPNDEQPKQVDEEGALKCDGEPVLDGFFRVVDPGVLEDCRSGQNAIERKREWNKG